MDTSRATQEIFYYTPTDENPAPTFDERERGAMRAYLQRCEVRNSTLHRIATAFVSGAGLLLLIPVFFKDVIDQLLIIMLAETVNQFAGWGEIWGSVATVILFIAVVYPMGVSLVIPLYGVYLLLKDIIHFYFSVYTPGNPEGLLVPTFSLSAIAFSPDESLKVKKEVMRYEYEPDKIDFMIPFSQEKRERYFDEMIRQTKSGIIPDNRHFDTLNSLGVLPHTHNDAEVARFNAALGLTGSLDRALVHEVAVAEMLLVRNNLYLRRLVLRYAKVLLVFIWTMFLSFLILPLLKFDHLPPFLVLSVGYLIWSIWVMPIIKTPLNWLYLHRKDKPKYEHIDAQLTLFEVGVERFVQASIGISIIAVLLALTAIVV